MFERVYASAWHHPGIFWFVGGAFLLWLLLRAPSKRGFVPLFTLLFLGEILLDAWFTSATMSPLPAGSKLGTVSAIAFVVLGDLRYLVLVERYRREATKMARWLPIAIGVSLLVPVASALFAEQLFAGDRRKLFATYEVMFALLALALLMWRLPSEGRDTPNGRWLRRLTQFEIAQYVLWASADAVILSGHDVGFALRLIPNTMYYAAFMPFCYFTAPLELRR